LLGRGRAGAEAHDPETPFSLAHLANYYSKQFQNRRGLSQFCAVRGAKWDCPLLRGGIETASNHSQPSTCVKSRADFGLGEADPLCVCSQSLFMLDLDDDVFRQIDERVPLIPIVSIERHLPVWVESLRETEAFLIGAACQ
jgi:hypothetical protein